MVYGNYDEKDITIDGNTFVERVVPGWDLVDIDYQVIQNLLFVRGFNWDYKYTQDNSGLEGIMASNTTCWFRSFCF